MSELEIELMKTKIEYYNSKKLYKFSDDELHEFMEFRRELGEWLYDTYENAVNYFCENYEELREGNLKL